MATDFSTWRSDEVSSNELENHARTQLRWDRGLILMTNSESSHQLYKQLVGLIDTRHDDEQGGIGRPGTGASRAPHCQERPRDHRCQSCTLRTKFWPTLEERGPGIFRATCMWGRLQASSLAESWAKPSRPHTDRSGHADRTLQEARHLSAQDRTSFSNRWLPVLGVREN